MIRTIQSITQEGEKLKIATRKKNQKTEPGQEETEISQDSGEAQEWV